MVLSMGPVYDRSRENLVPADRLVIRVRRRLLQAARELQDGTEPFHLQPEQAHELGSKWGLVDDPSRWPEVTVPGNLPFRLSDAEVQG
jgi:hypothetical protein